MRGAPTNDVSSFAKLVQTNCNGKRAPPETTANCFALKANAGEI